MDRVPDVAQLVAHFPNLEIQHLIGYGGMGAVYQARQPHLDRTVALKILSPRLSRNPAFAQRFMREARTLAKLAHPNIVMVFEFGQAGPLHYLLLEFVDGVNLRDAMLEGQMTTQEALAIVPQLCDALQYAHDEGIVHRDIKPENILLDKRGRVKIADFGLAKLVQPQAEDRRLTGTKQVLGTLSYMAPEQIEGRSTIDHRADIYSLGVVFYELLTGELPLGRFAVPSEKKPLDARLDEVVLRTLEKEPQRRYQHASEVKTAMQEISVVEAVATSGPAGPPASPSPAPENPQSPGWGAPHAQPVGGGGFNQPPAAAPAPVQPLLQSPPLPANWSPSPWTSASETIPFFISNVNYGFAEAQGLLKTSEQGLHIELEVRDAFFQATIVKPKSIGLPWNQIVSVKYQDGILNDSLLIQATSMTATADIPEARGGCATLKIKKNHRPEAKRLVTRLQRELVSPPTGKGAWGNGGWATPEPELPWVQALRKSGDYLFAHLPFSLSRRAINPLHVSARFSTVQFWFVTSGVLNFVLLSGSLRRKFRDLIEPLIEAPNSRLSFVADWLSNFDSVINPFSPQFGNAYFSLSIVLSILLFVAAEKMKYLKHYGFVAGVCAIALVPFYPTYLLCAPWALWGLLILLLPSSIATFDAVDPEGQVTETAGGGKASEMTAADSWISRPITHLTRWLMTAGLIVVSVAAVVWIAANHPSIAGSKGNVPRDTQTIDSSDAVASPIDRPPLPIGPTAGSTPGPLPESPPPPAAGPNPPPGGQSEERGDTRGQTHPPSDETLDPRDLSDEKNR
jgi:serine/threonine protein kinase